MKAKKAVKFPETLHECIRYFADEDRALDFMKFIRWPDGVVKCPRCGSQDVAFMPARRLWRCRADKAQFGVKIGTIMEDSPISLDKWLCAFWLIVNAKNGISSYELHRSLGVTQKTAWFLLHRIRLAMQDGSIEKFSGRIEADETYIGAKARNLHKNKKTGKRGMVGKTAVLGLLQREAGDKPSRVRCKVMNRVRTHDIDPAVRDNVEKGSEIMTDKFSSYLQAA